MVRVRGETFSMGNVSTYNFPISSFLLAMMDLLFNGEITNVLQGVKESSEQWSSPISKLGGREYLVDKLGKPLCLAGKLGNGSGRTLQALRSSPFAE